MSRSRPELLHETSAMHQRLTAVFQSLSREKGEVEDLEARDLMSAVGFVPPVDIYEDELCYLLELEIPGMNLDELDIRLEVGTLTVRGQRRTGLGMKTGNFTRSERRYGAFFRAFPLPHTVDLERIQARYEAGVLRIRLERRTDCESKQIKVEDVSAGTQPIAFVRRSSKSVA